ncbi:MAG: SDR family NAD(P)-dependent oxidoreductase [Oscillochloris sp.]|nr:SDR family NAD(P)-dependent oxidoreductase [Oscillochloris sp.]
MRVFLTGGTGFIGRPLARALLHRGWQVTALVRRPDSAEAQGLVADGATLAQGDVTDAASMRAPMQGADCVVHNAGWYEIGITAEAARLMQMINVDGTANTLRLALELGIPKTVHVSSIIAFGDTGAVLADEGYRRRHGPTSFYELSKAEAHAIAEYYQRCGLPLTIACPAAVIGPGDHSSWAYAVRMWVRGLYPPFFWTPNGNQSFVYVDDVAEGIALCAEHGQPDAAYILSAGTMTMRAVMELFATTPGGQRVRAYLPQALAETSAGMIEPLLRLIGLPAFISREAVRTTAMQMRFSGERAMRELSWQPRSVEQAWLDTLAAERTAVM